MRPYYDAPDRGGLRERLVHSIFSTDPSLAVPRRRYVMPSPSKQPNKRRATSYGGPKANTPGRLLGNADATFQRAMRHRAMNAKALRRIDDMLADEDATPEDFKWAWSQAADRGFGKAPQSVDMTTQGEQLHGVIILPAETPDG